MSHQLEVLSVFVASPSDVADERARLEEVIEELNLTWGRTLKLRLELIRWETHGFPGFGVDAQAVINQQLPTDYDIFIGIMWHRFGTPTGRADSGTEEEFTRAKARWDADHSSLQLMLYFKEAAISPSMIDPSQLAKVIAFRATLGALGGLYWTFQTTDDFVNLVRLHLSNAVQHWRARPAPPDGSKTPSTAITRPSSANLPAALDDDDIGLLELMEEFEDALTDSTDILVRIAHATTSMGRKFSEHTKRMNSLKMAGPVSPEVSKRVTAKAADDMVGYADLLHQELPLLRRLLDSGLGALSKAISFWGDFTLTGEDRGAAQAMIDMSRSLREQISIAEGHAQAFLDSTATIPRLTTNLNRAKRAMRTELENFIDLFQAQHLVLLECETAAEQMLKNQDPT